MASLLGLGSYCSGDESNASHDSASEATEFKPENINPALSIKSSICIDSAPLVLYSVNNQFIFYHYRLNK